MSEINFGNSVRSNRTWTEFKALIDGTKSSLPFFIDVETKLVRVPDPDKPNEPPTRTKDVSGMVTTVYAFASGAPVVFICTLYDAVTMPRGTTDENAVLMLADLKDFNDNFRSLAQG